MAGVSAAALLTAAALLYAHSVGALTDRGLTIAVLATLGVAGAAAVALIVAVADSFAQPLRAVVASLQRSASGNYETATELGAAGELRELADAVNAMRISLRSSADLARLSRSAAGGHGRGAADHRRRGPDRARERGGQRALRPTRSGARRQARRRSDRLERPPPRRRRRIAAARRRRATARRHVGQHLVYGREGAQRPRRREQGLRGAQHRRAQARRATDSLSRTDRPAHEDREPHAVPAPAAAGHRARAPHAAVRRDPLSRRRPLQGHQRHVRARGGRHEPRDLRSARARRAAARTRTPGASRATSSRCCSRATTGSRRS